MTTYSVVDPRGLARAARGVPTARSVEAGDEAVSYSYLDKDRDLMRVIVSILDPERLSAVTTLRMPDGHVFSALAAANAWNGRVDAHGTFSYMATIEGSQFMALESHLLVRGGVDGRNIEEWLRNFNERVNPFEETAASTIQELGSDAAVFAEEQRPTSSGAGWRVLGELIGGFLDS